MKAKTIAVLGGGSAGFTAAQIASQHGAKGAFFMGDDADHASLCVNAGCMPSKRFFRRSTQGITRNHMAGWK